MSKPSSIRLALSLAALSLAACSSSATTDSGETLHPTATALDLSVQTIHDGAGNAIYMRALKGTYGPNCRFHSGATWQLRLNDATDTTLEVARNETFASCPLTVTSIEISAAGMLIDDAVTPAVVLGRAYAPNPAHVMSDPSTLAFYANFRMTNLGSDAYTNSFGINMVFSDDATACNINAPPAVYAHVDGVASGSTVPPPTYSFGFAGLALMVDDNDVVTSSSAGGLTLQLFQGIDRPMVPGEEWRVFDSASDCCRTYSFSDIDNLYHRPSITRASIDGSGAVQISWTQLGLQGKVLPTYRTLIVRHTDPSSAVPSYELFQILFPGPVN